MRKRDQVDYILQKGHNPRYLSYVKLKKELIIPTIEPTVALRSTEFVIFAVPSAYLKDTLQLIDLELLESRQLGVSIKGMIPGTGYTPSHYLKKHTGFRDLRVTVLSGPCHAEEIANQKSTYITIAADDPGWANELCETIESNYIHAIPNNDPAGIEFTSVLKNIIAIATGMANGLQYGDNFQAVLVSNAMNEASRFLDSINPRVRNLFHSAYFGDLLVTAYSEYSRNRTLGKLVGRGIYINEALQAMEMIAEGFHASKELDPLLRKLEIELPVINSVHRVLHNHANPYHEFKLLESRLS